MITKAKLIGLFHKLGNKYVISLISFTVWMAFFDQFNWFYTYKLYEKEKALKEDLAYYSNEIARLQHEKFMIETDIRTVERFAREKYLMKKPNEDLFIVSGN